MSDVLIAILQFPNDPTNNRVAHQMFLATQTGNTIDTYIRFLPFLVKKKEYMVRIGIIMLPFSRQSIL